MKKKIHLAMRVLSVVFFLQVVGLSVYSAAGQDPVPLMIERIIRQDKLEGDRETYFRKLTALLFDYLRTAGKHEVLGLLYEASSAAELSRMLDKHLGQSVLDFGKKMFAFFETEAARDKNVDLKTWKAAEAGHFVFYTRPGSRADKDLNLIQKSAEGALASMIEALDIEAETEKCFGVLRTNVPKDVKEPSSISRAGRVAVFLHQAGSEEAKKLKGSMGKMSFGATILESGQEKGAGRLTAQVDILYFNSFSLTVLHHEIAHAALFLGSFDPGPLTAKPLKGPGDLKKAFFAGYKPIPPFLHEGIGDYVIYYQSFYKNWPLLPPPEKLVRTLFETKDFIPLTTLLKEGVQFRFRRHKAYSLEAASVVDFLIRAYGREKLKAWFKSPESDNLKAFEKTYGLTVAELETKWKADILDILK